MTSTVKRDRAEYHRKWYLKNSSKKAVQGKVWRTENRTRYNELAQRRASNNRVKTRSNQKKWRDKNKAYNALRMGKYRVNRRSLERAASVNLESINSWVKSVRSRDVNFCYYCEEQVALNSLHFDHVIPISKGGQHSVENLCVSCKKCNQIKSATLLSNWRHHNQLFLNL